MVAVLYCSYVVLGQFECCCNVRGILEDSEGFEPLRPAMPAEGSFRCEGFDQHADDRVQGFRCGHFIFVAEEAFQHWHV